MAAFLDIRFNTKRRIDLDRMDDSVKLRDLLKIPQLPFLAHHSKLIASIPSMAAILWIFFFVLSAGHVLAQPGEIGNSAATWLREHKRVESSDSSGKRIDIPQLKGATLFVGPGVNLEKPVPLVIHFHGAPWIVEQHIANHLPKAALVTVQLGAGSGVYGRPFAVENLLTELIDEAARIAGVKRGWSTITLTAFSAGYGAVRSILRHKAHFERVNGVLLLDGIHAGYEPERTPLSAGGSVLLKDLDVYFDLAREATAGRKYFVITHSQIHPGSYASTSECANQLLRELGLSREMNFQSRPPGMQQLTRVEKGRFRVFGYAGETAADHIDHIHAMPHWLGLLGVR